jgi:hypothetical protein
MASGAKKQLLDFVIERAFEPVMKAKPDGRFDGERKKLEHVQTAARSEIGRYRRYRSASELVLNFERDLTSAAAKKVDAESRALRLPTIEDVRDEFEAKAPALEVGGS